MNADIRLPLTVGLGEAKISLDAEDTLVALGLGSCVAVCAYDPVARVGGMLHAVLPEHNGRDDRPTKYVDSGVRHLIAEMESKGAARRRLAVGLVGGAQMLVGPGFAKALNIGERNWTIAKAVLAQEGLRVAIEDVGGSVGRTVRMRIADGHLFVRSVGSGEIELPLV